MAGKRKYYAKCKVWGDGVTMDVEGTIIGCMENMLMMFPADIRQQVLDVLQASKDRATQRRTEGGNAA